MALRDPRTKSGVHGHPRNPDPSGSRSHGDPTDQSVDVVKQVTKEQLIPQIANRTRNAVSIDGREVFLYQRLRAGRICSCWSGVNTTPHPQCPICFNTGFAGGFHKWGTDNYIFDPSRQWFGLNAQVNHAIGAPPWFSLETGFLSGYVEWDECMQRTTYYGLDHWRFEYRKSGGKVFLKYKIEGGVFQIFNENTFKQTLLTANGKRIKFRCYLERSVASDPSPLFQFFSFRTLVNSAEPPVIIVDIPRRNESNVLTEYGALETFQAIQMVFTDQVQRINLEDLVIRLFDMTKWKVIESSPNEPCNILTSHDVQLRKIFEDEGMNNVPI